MADANGNGNTAALHWSRSAFSFIPIPLPNAALYCRPHRPGEQFANFARFAYFTRWMRRVALGRHWA
jgi:hypothetical protein